MPGYPGTIVGQADEHRAHPRFRTLMHILPQARRPGIFEGVILPDSYKGVILINTFEGVFNLTFLKVYILRILSIVSINNMGSGEPDHSQVGGGRRRSKRPA